MGQVHHSKLLVDRENDGAMDFLTQISASRTSCTKQVRDDIATTNGRDGFVLTPPTGLKTRDFRGLDGVEGGNDYTTSPHQVPESGDTCLSDTCENSCSHQASSRPTHPHANYRSLTASTEPSSHSESVATAGAGSGDIAPENGDHCLFPATLRPSATGCRICCIFPIAA